MKDFAAALGISFAAYQNYEYGKRVPPGPVLAKLSEISGRSVDWILTGIEPGAGADRVAESRAPYGLDDVTAKVVDMLRGMDEEARRDVLKYAEKIKPFYKKKLKEGA
jgi:transcriptional regulator with XRE-family HTH domain